ncbi:hypothetical protein BpHYR1_046983 [Brachionus plicatilis]|uniref:Uncharacterized protein n=1 Tax=Brachionus plicatilis TaxID=10195 RepID=A0A3M7SDR5_BRAPC|nr:hypothetical protein BpHYR1_046983 [Brachionus plicatilis]
MVEMVFVACTKAVLLSIRLQYKARVNGAIPLEVVCLFCALRTALFIFIYNCFIINLKPHFLFLLIVYSICCGIKILYP